MPDTRPPGVDVPFRPGDTFTVTFNWSAGALSGRTFTATLDAATLTVSVVGDVLTVSATGAQTTTAGLGTHAFALTETTGGGSNEVIVGTWTGSNSPSTSTTATVTVTNASGTVTVDVSGQAGLTAHQRTRDHDPLQALAYIRAELVRARSGGLSTVIGWVGDSIPEGYDAQTRGMRAMCRLSHRMGGPYHSSGQFVPLTTGALNTTTATDWPGDQVPWTYSGSVSVANSFGPDLHAGTVSSGGFAELAYNGSRVEVFYVRETTGPSAAAVTIDGTSVGTINANGSLLGGRKATFDPADGYGAHVLRINATSAPFTIEGVKVYDDTIFFGGNVGTVDCYSFGHGGFQTQDFVSRPSFATSLAAICGAAQTGGLLLWTLGANDIGASVPVATYRANYAAILAAVDAAWTAASLTVLPRHVLVQVPTLTSAYRGAAWDIATAFGLSRCGVLDLASMSIDDGTVWPVALSDMGHPNNSGQQWIADQFADLIDPSGWQVPSMRPGGPVIEATDEPAVRLSWTASFGITTGGFTYDAANASADTTVRERRHRTWLDPGTYVARVRYEQRTTNGGTIEVLVGKPVGAATSCGTVSTAGTDNVIGETQLATSVTIDAPGWYPVTVRKTSTNGIVRFARLHLRKTG